MSGNPPEVQLAGPESVRLLSALPVLSERIGRRFVLIGGLAVLARLSTPHRATTDVDTAQMLDEGAAPTLEILLSHADTKPADQAGLRLPTPRGTVKVDVIDIRPADLTPISADPNDILYSLAHAWAIETGEDVRLTAASGSISATTRVATTGPLVAMKLQSAMNRGAEKQATDLWDIVVLLRDGVAGPAALAELERASSDLAAAARFHVRRWFVEKSTSTLRSIRTIPAADSVTADDLTSLADVLLAALTR